MSKTRYGSGEDNINAKLTVDLLRDAATEYLNGRSIQSLADSLQVSGVSLRYAFAGKTWKHAGLDLEALAVRVADGRRGERQHMALLTRSQIVEVKRLHAEGVSQREIAERFGVSQSAISHVTTGKTWKHILTPHIPSFVGSAKGERNPNAKLTDAEVGSIRHLAAEGLVYADIARRFNVTPTIITGLVQGKHWKHIPLESDPPPLRPRVAVEMPDIPSQYQDRFWLLVDRSGGEESCWEWRGVRDGRNYGAFRLPGGRSFKAHRVAFAIAVRKPLPCENIRHNCPGGDNRACVNPAHLLPGSYQDNVDDRTRKGTSPRGSRRPAGYHGLKWKPARTTEERFWDQVDKRGPDDCWIWLGEKDSRNGHGSFRSATKKTGAHRFSYESAHGLLPRHIYVCHDCPGGDNPLCVNPNHLYEGTAQDNVRDRDRKRRLRALNR